jgi:hypothetical protein
MTTARNIITSAMRKIGALTKNETPSADEAADGLEMLNDMLASWSNDSISITARTLENFPLTGAASYTIGVGGNFNTSRPIYIAGAYTRSGSIDYPMTPMTDEDYAQLPLKSTAGLPDRFNYSNAYPLGVFKFYPVPDASHTLYILTEKPLSSFASLATEVDLPPGTNRALIYNLSIEMSPEYGQPVTTEIAEIASSSKGALSRAIIRTRSMDVPVGSSFGNINSGFF